MKKLILVFASVLISLSVLSAAEPLAVASLASPAFIAIGSMDGTAEADSLSDDELFILTLPERVLDSGIMLQRAFSLNPVRVAGFAWDAYGIYSSREDFVPVSASGSISFAPSWNADEGRLSLGISYDDVSLSYMDGKDEMTTAIDGSAVISASFYDDSIITLAIDTDDISVSGNTDLYNSSIDMKFFFNRDDVYAYMESYDFETARRIVTSLIIRSPFGSILGLPEGAGYEDVMAFAEENNATDLIDTLAFVSVALSDASLSYLDIFSMAATPVLYIDGEPSDIDLTKAVDVAKTVLSIVNKVM